MTKSDFIQLEGQGGMLWHFYGLIVLSLVVKFASLYNPDSHLSMTRCPFAELKLGFGETFALRLLNCVIMCLWNFLVTEGVMFLQNFSCQNDILTTFEV